MNKKVLTGVGFGAILLAISARGYLLDQPLPSLIAAVPLVPPSPIAVSDGYQSVRLPTIGTPSSSLNDVNHNIDDLSTNIGSNPSLIIGSTNPILIVATISDQAVLPMSVNLFEQAATGNPVLLGILRDDGLNGDLIAGDKVFTFALYGSDLAGEGKYSLFVTAAFGGSLKRVRSKSIDLTVLPHLAAVDRTWKKYQDSQLSISTPGEWIPISTSTTVLAGTSTSPLRTLSFALPTDPTDPVLYIYVYRHGYQLDDTIDEQPSYLGTNNSADFYFEIRNAASDPTVLSPLGLTDDSLHADVLQALATFQVGN